MTSPVKPKTDSLSDIENTRKFRRLPHLVSRIIEGEFYVINEANAQIETLDAQSSAVWRLLEKSTSIATATDDFSRAFPEADKDQLHKLISNIFQTFHAHGLIY